MTTSSSSPTSSWNDEVRRAIEIGPQSSARDRTIDVTTVGAKSGIARRIETWFYRFDGQVYLSGAPGRRSWYANLIANPEFVFHLKHGVQADLQAIATPIADAVDKRRILTGILADLNQPSNPARLSQPVGPLEDWVNGSPLAKVDFINPSGR